MDIKEVETIMKRLKRSPGFFVSEAHLQMSFVKELILLKHYSAYPEYPVKGKQKEDGKYKRDEIDLCVVDERNKKKTFIEFKYKTLENVVMINNDKSVSIELKNHFAQNLGRYDCWKDIERLEYHMSMKHADQGFFIFVTNDGVYKNDGNIDKSVFGSAFSMKEGRHESGTKEWKDLSKADESVRKKREKSVGKNRMEPIAINNTYDFNYSLFNTAVSGRHREFDLLIVEINKG